MQLLSDRSFLPGNHRTSLRHVEPKSCNSLLHFDVSYCLQITASLCQGTARMIGAGVSRVSFIYPALAVVLETAALDVVFLSSAINQAVTLAYTRYLVSLPASTQVTGTLQPIYIEASPEVVLETNDRPGSIGAKARSPSFDDSYQATSPFDEALFEYGNPNDPGDSMGMRSNPGGPGPSDDSEEDAMPAWGTGAQTPGGARGASQGSSFFRDPVPAYEEPGYDEPSVADPAVTGTEDSMGAWPSQLSGVQSYGEEDSRAVPTATPSLRGDAAVPSPQIGVRDLGLRPRPVPVEVPRPAVLRGDPPVPHVTKEELDNFRRFISEGLVINPQRTPQEEAAHRASVVAARSVVGKSTALRGAVPPPPRAAASARPVWGDGEGMGQLNTAGGGVGEMNPHDKLQLIVQAAQQAAGHDMLPSGRSGEQGKAGGIQWGREVQGLHGLAPHVDQQVVPVSAPAAPPVRVRPARPTEWVLPAGGAAAGASCEADSGGGQPLHIVRSKLSGMNARNLAGYEGRHKGETGAVLCAGKTLDLMANTLRDSLGRPIVTVATNELVFLDHPGVRLDYYLITDTSPERGVAQNLPEMDAFVPRRAKFLAVYDADIPSSRAQQVRGAMQVEVAGLPEAGWPLEHDLASRAFGTFGTGLPPPPEERGFFLALQFILFTGVSRVYLIGCDTDQSLSDDINEAGAFELPHTNKPAWSHHQDEEPLAAALLSAHTFAGWHYPCAEVVVVNARGLMRDVGWKQMDM
eukprot:jgi/Mesvir1/23908/Mv10688-RA.1